VSFFFEETGNKQKILEKRKYFSGILNELKIKKSSKLSVKKLHLILSPKNSGKCSMLILIISKFP